MNNTKKTLSTYLDEILGTLKFQEKSLKEKEEKDQFHISYLFGFLAFLSLSLITNGSQDHPDFSWIDNNKFALKLWGVSLATIYLGVSVERLTFFRPLWGYTITKVAVSVAFSLLLVFCTGKAAGIINSVFGIDASAFPFTLTFTTALILFNYLIPVIFILAIVGFVHLFIVVAWFNSYLKKKETTLYEVPGNSIFFVILCGIVVYFGMKWSNDNFSYEAMPQKVYLLAHKLDFNSKNECENIDDNTPVIFIGNSQGVVLADRKSHEIPSVEWFFESDIQVPNNFYRINCDLKKYPAK